MIPLILLASLIAAPAAVSAGSGPERLITRGEGFIRAPVNAIQGKVPSLRARQNEVEIENQRTGTRYGVDIEIGTPPQRVTLILDTGSPDTWVNPTCQTANVPSDCRAFPRYDYTKSSSVNVTRASDVLLYGIGNSTIQYVFETVKIGSATISNQVIGVSVESHQIPLGILGLSPAIRGVNEYPYILDTMKAQGLIKSRAFSMDLRTVDSEEGALIFGGIDTGKYIGVLAKLPMLARSQTPLGADRYYVTMTGVGLTYPDGRVERSQDINVPVFLDSGGTLSRLPTPIYNAFAASFQGAEFDARTGFYFLPCSIADLSGSVDFYFAGKTIRVPFRDFIWHVQGYCVLGVLPEDEEPVLGDTFLRAAYVVFDQDNRNLHIAQAADCGTNLVAIGSGSDAVPSATGRCTATPRPTGTLAGSNLDLTATRSPTAMFTGAGPTNVDVGPGPAASKISGTGSLEPTGTGKPNAAGRAFAPGLGAMAGLTAVIALAMVF